MREMVYDRVSKFEMVYDRVQVRKLPHIGDRRLATEKPEKQPWRV